MAAICIRKCDICMLNFNEVDRKSVELPCGDDFCLACVDKLKSNGSLMCPKCCLQWAKLDVEALSGVKKVEGAVCLQKKEGASGGIKKAANRLDLCKEHGLPYHLWCIDDEAFYCLQCVVKNSNKKVELIKDALPLISSYLKKKADQKTQQIKLDIDDLENIEEQVNQKYITLQDYKDAILELERKTQHRLSTIRTLKTDKEKACDVVAKVERKITNVKSDSDMPLVVEINTILESSAQAVVPPSLKDSEDLIHNIAQVYTTLASSEHPLSLPGYIRGLQKASGNSIGPFTQLVRGAVDLEGGKKWTIDSSTCVSALLALADRQPSVLALVARPDEAEALPTEAVAAITKAAKSCNVQARFLDSFLMPQESTTDLKRLQEITKHSSLRLTHFYGHLDADGTRNIPRSVRWLGLSICNKADAKVASALRPWGSLRMIGISISSGVAADDLRPLPIVPVTDLYFPRLTDARVANVRPAIEALVPSRRSISLRLPSSQLTTDGFRRLTASLHGLQISGVVSIDLMNPWHLEEAEKESVAAMFLKEISCSVAWDINSLFGR